MDDTTVTAAWSLLILVLYGKLTECRWSLNVQVIILPNLPLGKKANSFLQVTLKLLYIFMSLVSRSGKHINPFSVIQ